MAPGLPEHSDIYLHSRWNIKIGERDFPSGPVVKSPPSNAGFAGSIPGQGTKIPHAVGLLSPRSTTRDKPACRNKESMCHN